MKRKTKQFLTLFLAASLVVADGSFAVLADTVSGNQIEAEATVTEDVEMAKEAETTEEVETTEEQEEVLATEAEGEESEEGQQTGDGEQSENNVLDLSQYDSEETALPADELIGKDITYTSEADEVYLSVNLEAGKAYQLQVQGVKDLQVYYHPNENSSYRNSLAYDYTYGEMTNIYFGPEETREYFVNLGVRSSEMTFSLTEIPFCIRKKGYVSNNIFGALENGDSTIIKTYGQDWSMKCQVSKPEDMSLVYQWYKGNLKDKENLVLIEDATTDEYAYPNTVEELDYDYYKCVITDEASGFSQTADFVLSITTLIVKNTSVSIKTAENKELILKPEITNLVDGTDLTYKWTHNQTPGNYDYVEYEEEKGDSLILSPEDVVMGMSDFYECFVSNGYKSERIVFQVQLSAGLRIKGNSWRTVSVWAGDEIDLIPPVESREELSYQWIVDNVTTECTDATYHLVVPQDLEQCPQKVECKISDKYESGTIRYDLSKQTEPGKKPIGFVMAEQDRLWTICEGAQEYLPTLVNFDGEYSDWAFKIIYEENGEETSELKSASSYILNIDRDSDNRWKAGWGSVAYSYDRFTIERPFYVVRMGENGTIIDVDADSVSAKAGSNTDQFAFFKTELPNDAKYQFKLTNVKGNGTLLLYQSTYSRYAKEYELKDGEDLIIPWKIDRYGDHAKGTYYLIASGETGEVSFDLSVVENKIIVTENTPIDVQESDVIYFTPEKDGFYGLTDKTERKNSFSITNLLAGQSAYLEKAYYLKADTTYLIKAEAADTFEISFVKQADQDYVFASADDGTKYEFFEDGTYCITVNDSNRYVRNELPSELGEEVKKLVIKGVAKKIVSHAFDYGLTNMESVNIEAPIEEIGYRAFYGNKNLKTVEVAKPELLKVVGQQAFEGTAFYEEQQGNYAMLGTCVVGYKKDSGETATVIPEKATMVAERAMQGVDTLEKIEILQNLKYIDSYSMSNNEKLQNMDIPGNVTDIAYCAFLFDRSMTYVKMAEGVEYIGEMAFHGCDDLKDVWIPKSVAYIGSWAIGYTGHPQYVNGNYYSYSYKKASDVDDEEEEEPKDELIIHCYFDTEGFRYAHNNGFKMDLMDAKDLANEKIARVNYGTSDGKIDYVNVTFARYIDLKDGVDFEYKVENGKIIITGKGDYFGTRIIDPNASVPSEEPSEEPSTSPSAGPSTEVLPSGKPSADVIPSEKPSVSPSSQPSQEVSAGPSESTSPSASASPSADVTPSVKPSISPSAKPSVSPSVKPSTQPSQAPAELEAGKSYEAQGAKVTRGEDGNVVYQGPADANATNVTVPSKVVIGNKEYQVTEIADKAFEKNTKLKKVKIPAGIKTIGKNAFNKCTNLTSVTMGSDVTEIKDSAFAGCTKLTKVTISKKVTTIGKNAFKGDKKLKSIVIKSTNLKSVKSGAFKGIAANAVIKVPKAKLKEYQKLLKKKGQGSKVKIKK